MNLPEEMKGLFKEMMCENSTLLDCSFFYGDGENDPICEVIQFHMELNRMWKRYVMKRNEESLAVIVNGTATVTTTASTVEANNKKILKMRLLLHLFMKKPVMRDTIIFHLLREYPDDLGLLTNDDTQQQQQSPLLLRMIRSNVAKKKRKRTTGTDDGENKSNEGTADPNDNDGVINSCESGSDDGTDGTF